MLLEALAAGRTLVVDRYAYSGAAFTAAKRLRGLDLAWCQVRATPVPCCRRHVPAGLAAQHLCPAAGNLLLASSACA